jgi:membrane protease subunit (stomatin/prohibitin family)
MAANQAALGKQIEAEMKANFATLGLELASFVVENISLPEELQKVMDARIGVSMAGDLNKYTQFQAAQALPVAAANSGGAAGMGVGLGAGAVMGQNMMAAIKQPSVEAPPAVGARRFCVDCGASIPDAAKFCPACGRAV